MAWQALDPFLTEVEELPWSSAPLQECTKTVSIEDANEAFLERAAGWARCSQASWSRVSVTASQNSQKIQFQKLQMPNELPLGVRADAGPAWGDLIHRLLEHAMRGPRRDEEHLLLLAEWFVFEQPELEDLIPLAVQTVMAVMETDFWKQATRQQQRLVEVPFGVRSKVDGSLVFGILDLVLGKSEKWQIVDYKTDLSSLNHLVEKYSGQLQSYAENWSQLTEQELTSAGIFRIRSAETAIIEPN
jgi:ATP-dependent exoDNAse (exonuclease V) beta subunit